GGWNAFAGSWANGLTVNGEEDGTSGAYQTAVFPAVTTFLTSLTGWQKLAPDTRSGFITAGRGTRAAPFKEGPRSRTPYDAGGTPDTYVAGSVAGDGTLGLIYFSPGVTTTITIDQTKLVAGYVANWVDPCTCALTSQATGSTYTKPATANSAGDHDWVLLLQA